MSSGIAILTAMQERWAAVPGWEGWYEVSDLGHCRGIKRPRKGSARNMFEPYPLVLTPLWYRKGYYKIQFGSCDGARQPKRLYIHRVVWEAFNGPIPPDLTVNHIDGIHDNNKLDNLELATHQEQHTHARKMGLTRRWNGAQPHLTIEDVAEIRRAYSAGEATYDELAARFLVVKGTIGHILARRAWKHVP